MQYMLLIYEPEAGFMGEAGQARLMEVVGKHMALAKEMREAGAMQSGSGLQPVTTATTIITNGGGQTLHDGPFAETREQLGGYYLIDVADLDTALGYARRIPVVDGGKVEVRPLATY